VDVSDLAVNQGIRVKDVATSPKWKPVTDVDTMLVHVILTKAEEAAPAAAGAVAAGSEPEVIKKGKKDEAEGDKKK